MSYIKKDKLQRQLNLKNKEIADLKKKLKIASETKPEQAINNKKRYNIFLSFVEFFLVAVLVSIGSSAVVAGLQAIHFPCDGRYCGEIATAGGVMLTVGSILIFVAAQIILWVNAVKD